MQQPLRTRWGRGRIRAGFNVATVLCATVGLMTPAILAQTHDDSGKGAAGTAGEAAWQAGSLLATLPYGAAKIGVAAAGGVIGGLGYVFSGGDLESSQQIWSSFMGGTYVLTPEHLKGEEPVIFLAIPEEPPTDQQP